MKPYEITGQVKRLDVRNTSFARSKTDPAHPAYGKQSRCREELAASGRKGFTPEEFVFSAAARAADGLIRRSWRGHSDQPAGQQGQSAQPASRYEPADWRAFTERLKRAAVFYGAALVGVARVNPLWLYDGETRAELPQGLGTAVVMAIEMDYDLIATSPGLGATAATGKGYSQMAFVASCVAKYLGELGWQAVPSGNDIALSIPLAIDAGLGEPGRNGMLITRRYGPRVRLCKVFTDAPLACDEPVTFGVREFCTDCTLCADACPSRSIPRGEMTDSGPTPSNCNGVRKWYVNGDACLAFWQRNGTNCCNCIRSCPYNRKP